MTFNKLDDRRYAIAVAGIICSAMLAMTGGRHGAGWFIIAILLLW